MDKTTSGVLSFLETVHPYDVLPREELTELASAFSRKKLSPDTLIFEEGDLLEGIYLIERGAVEVTDSNGELVSVLSARNHFGERGLLRDGKAATTARAAEDTVVLLLPPKNFLSEVDQNTAFARYFNRGQARAATSGGLMAYQVSDLMASEPATCTPDLSIRAAAEIMRDKGISSIGVVEADKLVGILTARDLTNRVVAAGVDSAQPVKSVMTGDPITLAPNALGSDVLHKMVEHSISHVPVTDGGQFLGMVTQTDLTRFHGSSQAQLIFDVGSAEGIQGMAETCERLPQFLMQLVGAHLAHDVITHKITDIADIVTRRLLKMAEEKLGAAPVPYLWAACGSQGRQEQTGVSDQDNCLIIHDSATDDDMKYFAELAKFVSDGLDACGYFYCPGDMMATNPRWCQRQSVWRDYFSGWIRTPDPMAQMLASVMFDLRPIGGDESLFHSMFEETLTRASKNSIFVAHMISNSLGHVPPLSLLRGFATIRSGEHKNQIDMKHNGVVPIVDLGRVYALQGGLAVANTRARIEAGIDAGVVSDSGGQDLLAAYDTIAEARLEHQGAQVRLGEKPDNFLTPSSLPAFERSHLRDAFVIVRTMQSSLSHSGAR